MTTIRLTRASDVDLNPDSIASAESSYRRGYVQGYAAALQDRINGHASGACEAHMLDALMSWRYGSTGDHFPPELPIKPKTRKE